MSYGDLDFTQHLQYIEEAALKNFERLDVPSEIIKEPGFSAPISKEVKFMPDLMSEPESQVKLGMTFLCNEMA